MQIIDQLPHQDQQQAYIQVNLPGAPRSISAHPTKSMYAVLCAGGTVFLVDGGSKQIVERYRVSRSFLSDPIQPRHNGQIHFTPDGNSVVVFGNKASSGLYVLDANNLQPCFAHFDNSRQLIQQTDFSPDGQVIAVAGGRANQVSFIDLATGKQAASPIDHPSAVYSARFSPDGELLVTGCRDGQSRVYRWRSGRLVTRALEHDRDVVNARFAHDGKSVLTLSEDKLLKVWSVDTGLLTCPPIVVGDGMKYLDYSEPLNKAVVSGRIPKAVAVDLRQPSLQEGIQQRELYLLAELVSHASIVNAGTVRLTTEDWISRWRDYAKTQLCASHIAEVFPKGTETTDKQLN